MKLSRYCPHCGHPLKEDDRYCPNCGYDLGKQEEPSQDTASSKTNQSTTQSNVSKLTREDTRKSRTPQQPKKRPTNHKKAVLITIIIIILVCLIGGCFLYSQNNNSAHNTSNISSENNSSSTPNSQNSAPDNNSEATDSAKLSMSMGPKETAAAITTYAAKHGDQKWKGLLDGSTGWTVRLDRDADHLGKLNAPGSGMAYDVFGYTDVASDDDTEFVYTLEKDDTVNIYQVDNGIDAGDDDNAPIETVSKKTILDWLNANGYAEQVKRMSHNVNIQQ